MKNLNENLNNTLLLAQDLQNFPNLKISVFEMSAKRNKINLKEKGTLAESEIDIIDNENSIFNNSNFGDYSGLELISTKLKPSKFYFLSLV